MTPTERQTDNMFYNDADLALVLTRQEVRITWGKSFTQIDMAIATNRLSARTALTGGTVLISSQDCFRIWGPPKDKSVFRLYRGRVEPFNGFGSMLQAPETSKKHKPVGE